MTVWDIDPILLDFGKLQVRYYGVLFAVALFGGYRFWSWQCMRAGKTQDYADKFLTIGVIAVIGGSRFGHVVFYDWDKYAGRRIEMLYFWKGGLASHGATLGLIVALAFFSWRHRMRLIEVFDRFSMSAAWAAFAVRLGNLMNSEIVGRQVDPEQVPWAFKFPRHDRGMDIEAVPWRHPSQIYEMGLGLTTLSVLLLADKFLGRERRPLGALASIFFLVYFTGRFFVEYFKEFQTLNGQESAFTMGQYLSMPFIGIGLIGLITALKLGVVTNANAEPKTEEA